MNSADDFDLPPSYINILKPPHLAAAKGLVDSDPDAVCAFVSHIDLEFLDRAALAPAGDNYFDLLAALAAVPAIGAHMRTKEMVSRIARAMLREVQYSAAPRIRHAVVALTAIAGAPPRPRCALLDATTGGLLPGVRGAVCATWRRFRSLTDRGITADGLKALFELWCDQANSVAAREQRARRILANGAYETVSVATPYLALTETGFCQYYTKLTLLHPARAGDMLQLMAPRFVAASALSSRSDGGAEADSAPVALDAAALPECCVAQLRAQSFIETLVQYDDSVAYGELVAQLSNGDGRTSTVVAEALVNQCSRLLRIASGQRNYRTAAPPGALLSAQLGLLFNAIARVLAVADALQSERVELIVDRLMALAAEQRDARGTLASGKMPLVALIVSLVELRDGASLVEAALTARPEAWRWMLPWLADALCIVGLAGEKAAALTKLLLMHRDTLVAEGVVSTDALQWLSPPPPVLSAALLSPRAAATAASLPLLSILVSNAGSDEVNGVYVADTTESGDRLRWTKIDTPANVGTYVLKPDDRVRLFRCRLSSHGHAWYISATGPRSGVDTDVDFYEFQQQRGARTTPPQRGWTLSQQAMAYARHPPPTVQRADAWFRLTELCAPTAERRPPQPPSGPRTSQFADLQLANIDNRGSEDSDDSIHAVGSGSS